MRTLTRQSQSQVDEENPYWISFSDIMAGLLVIFMLAAVVFIMELIQKSERWDKAIEEIAKAEEVRKNILAEVEQELRNKNIPVEVIYNDTVLRIPQDVLTFEPASSDLPADKQIRQVAEEIGNVLFSAITKEERWKYLDTIFVEGHTDPDPYKNPMLKGNWGLSTMRAISLWLFWNEEMSEGERLDSLVNHDGKKLFSVSGYAETRPPACDIDEKGECIILDDERDAYQKYRRIDIRFTVRRPAIEQYRSVKDALN
jgi:flagellar motor protein MotB